MDSIPTMTTMATQLAAPATRPVPAYSTFSGDGREERLLASLLAQKSTLQGNPELVLKAIDEFAKSEDGGYLMNVGDEKGRVVEDVIKETGAKLVLELGTYIGYSTIKFARHLISLHSPSSGEGSTLFPSHWPSSPPPSDSSAQLVGYICLEKSPLYARVAQALVELAGLGEVVQILVGPSTLSILHLHTLLPTLKPGTKFDVVFLDHHKPLYTLDLKALEEGGWVGSGTRVVADNVVKPGNPRYLAYVRGKAPGGEKEDVGLEGGKVCGDEMEEVDEETGTVISGVAGLRYESRLVLSCDPYTGEEDGIELSTCVGIEDVLEPLETRSCV